MSVVASVDKRDGTPGAFHTHPKSHFELYCAVPYHAFAPGWEEDVKKTAEMGSGYASDGPTNMGRARGDNRVENDNFDHEAIE